MDRNDLLNLFDTTTTHCRSVMEAKNSDYCGGKAGAAADPFANFRISEVIGVHPVLGLMMRMLDKMQRIKAFVADGELSVANETVDDAFDDLVNYSILGKGLMRDMREAQRRATPAVAPVYDVELERYLGDASL